VDLNLNDITVTHNEAAHRFEASIGGLLAVITYRRFPDRIVYTHTEVPTPLEGHGMAAHLAAVALDFARVNHLRVVPFCPYISRFIGKHPEYQDLVNSDDLQKVLSR
jgi:predicted GNAT family acetyltransferase